ncbi:alpha/beta fold hydrolase [Pelistega europaea]|uniref:Alpha/beta hydrolase n=1 Tax=Pelistega europaea TaxID=106147 RepID=A0A7Y4LB28_9BURK|nr:alpha/beta hydrolase [Pelistega europaea]NOL50270.1 alpha/beta hydrolase [Pelistega europaea]
MAEPRLRYVICTNPQGFHRMAYWEWGDPENDKVLLCVHGLTRNGRDFDEVARVMSMTHRVICPDVVGRGASDRHDNAKFYAVPYYVADMMTLLAQTNARSIDFLGTSMGGMIGIVMVGFNALLRAKAAQNPHLPEDAYLPFQKLILNDVGPRLERADLNKIAENTANPVSFASLEEALPVMKERAASFGPMSEDNWQAFVRTTLHLVDGKWVSNYDVKIAEGFAELAQPGAVEKSEAIMWGLYRTIDIPTLVIHGAASELLSSNGVEMMVQANPLTEVVDIPLVGHAPSLLEPEQVKIVKDFLLKV